MIVNFIGPREPGNHFKKKIAEHFDCPVLSFNELSEQLFEDLNELYNVKMTGLRRNSELHLLLREKITKRHPRFYMDWMSQQLVENVFRKNPSQTRQVQCVILDVDTEWEYKVLRTFLLSPKNKKANKMILIENDDVRYNWYNEGFTQFTNWEIDGVISKEDEDPGKEVEKILKSWYAVKGN